MSAYDTIQTSTDAFEIIQSMPPIDLFDYLADHAQEPRTPEETHPLAMLASVLADVAKVGPEVFCERMRRMAGIEGDETDL